MTEPSPSGPREHAWYARAPEDVATAFGVGPAVGLSGARATELLAAHGPNALPDERRAPAWRRWPARRPGTSGSAW
ncbi:cation-transporting P-type ATPase [Streptomyces sp. MA5143a]|uniref:cation-transporting P-type ATPase n=1 Tax=Streptomyces sp. MA5143a TaxID=2083010 RepID=UPI000D1B423F|nr:cation-transporting P-type ATPase [Streptomyces sp. MA5143a]SPF04379.1 hypothetical protein SMA5143A_5176 [Streptomyces sp. MA5143a]